MAASAQTCSVAADLAHGKARISRSSFCMAGQVSEDTYKIITNNCTRDELIYGVTEPKCKGAIDRMETEVGGFYAYNLYDDCWYENDFNSVHVADRSYWGPPKLTGASTSDGFSRRLMTILAAAWARWPDG